MRQPSPDGPPHGRRHFLQAGLASLAAPWIASCDQTVSNLDRRFGRRFPTFLSPPDSPNLDPDYHLLHRSSFGMSPFDLADLRALSPFPQSRHSAWLDLQLAPDQIPDTLCELRASRANTLALPLDFLYECRHEDVRQGLVRQTFLRAIYSRRQLFERMVGFWTDHFNVDIAKGDCIYLKPLDDAHVIRPNALGLFPALLRASATSPAMLVYLDGTENRVLKEGDAPNENYARELLELHSLGVDGGYSQQDVFEAARCLSGWHFWRHGNWDFQRHREWGGLVTFEPSAHDPGTKSVLGQTIAAGGGHKDLDDLVEIVAHHPSTARHIAHKLCRTFLAEDPPAAAIADAAATFSSTRGDIAKTVRTILAHPSFASTAGLHFKRPFHFVVSALRALAADTHAPDQLLAYLRRMGQAPFEHPTPDGYPLGSEHWTGSLLWRWDLSFSLAATATGLSRSALPDGLAPVPGLSIPGGELLRLATPHGALQTQEDVAFLFAYLVGRMPSGPESQILNTWWHDHFQPDPAHLAAADLAQLVGLLLSSPAFQRC
jgi:hypothetical protein